ncbi:CBS domain-containing protein [Cognatilysobacter bugurensis]|uniref:Histidine kinase n=1 Tax=Cognatilysobacter bugurensis TaxID=543356 RepID=A0A918W8I9_9GAMM|nr:CBS domain-containing protein [Lysobacter bugurensis]GHA77793.1 histidine kinase [Lysobacter bugurensis]
MRSVHQVLQAKTPEIHSIGPDAPVLDAIRTMAEHGIGALLVMEGGQLVGLISERDYARKVVLQGRSSRDTPVRAVMSEQVITVGPLDTVDDCMRTVTGRRVRHLPVMQDGQVIGVVSIGDLVKAVIEDQQVELDQLQRYIAS